MHPIKHEHHIMHTLQPQVWYYGVSYVLGSRLRFVQAVAVSGYGLFGWVLALIHFLALTHWNLGPGCRSQVALSMGAVQKGLRTLC